MPGNRSVGSAYGAAGSLVVFIVWVYYSAQIFFLGAEFTHVYAERHGSRAHQRAGDEPTAAQAEVNRFLEILPQLIAEMNPELDWTTSPQLAGPVLTGTSV